MSHAQVNFSRARLLLQQGRYADAERELRQTLAQDPHWAEPHALLAEALLEQQKLQEAFAEAAQSITLDPQMEVGHYVMARVLMARNRHKEAEHAVRTAIELAPYPRSFGLLAAIRFEWRDWTGALEAANEGLAFDPQDSACLNLRAMALRQLGRHDDADRTLHGALESDPDDSYAHANRGWSELHRGRPREAQTHFKEALRLDPTNEHARAGLVEAIKARNVIYRGLLGYFLWMNRLNHRAQFAIVIGGWIGWQFLRAFEAKNPQYAVITTPLIVAYVVFAWMTWLAVPLGDLALRLHPVGRHALSANQRRTANIVGALLLAAGITFAVSRWKLSGDLDVLALFTALATMPGSLIFRAAEGWPRWVLAAMTAVLPLFAGVVVLVDLGVLPKLLHVLLLPASVPLLLICVFGSQWVAAQRVRR